MDGARHPPVASTHGTVAIDEVQRLAVRRAAAAVCGISSPLQAAAAAPLWRALSDESAAWLLTLMPPGR